MPSHPPIIVTIVVQGTRYQPQQSNILIIPTPNVPRKAVVTGKVAPPDGIEEGVDYLFYIGSTDVNHS